MLYTCNTKVPCQRARERVPCTFDLWTDDSQRAFMSITTHYYNGHKRLVNRLIAFRVIEGTHAGADPAETLFEVLEEYDLGSFKRCAM
jgi:hypothetical protein